MLNTNGRYAVGGQLETATPSRRENVFHLLR
jgi:hypothetical protein